MRITRWMTGSLWLRISGLAALVGGVFGLARPSRCESCPGPVYTSIEESDEDSIHCMTPESLATILKGTATANGEFLVNGTQTKATNRSCPEGMIRIKTAEPLKVDPTEGWEEL